MMLLSLKRTSPKHAAFGREYAAIKQRIVTILLTLSILFAASLAGAVETATCGEAAAYLASVD